MSKYFGLDRQFQPIDHPRFQINSLRYKGGGDYEVEETADQKELARIASEKWTHYQEKFIPVENLYIDEARNADSPARMNSALSASTAASKQASGEALDETIHGLTSQGVESSSGKFKSAIRDHSIDSSANETDINVRTGQAIQDDKLRALQNVVNIGSGQEAVALTGLQNVASESAAQAEDKAFKRSSRRRSNIAAAGTVAGAGFRSAINDDEDL